MTFCGYSDNDILAQKQEIEKTAQECLEHPELCIPLSEVFGEGSDAGDEDDEGAKNRKSKSFSSGVPGGRLRS